MKLHLSNPTGINLIAAYGDNYIQIREQRHQDSLILLPDAITDWPVPAFSALTAAHLTQLLQYGPELVLLGTGRRHRLPPAALYGDLVNAGVGLESMDTGAACRTYNILAADGRRVAAALIIEV